MDYIKELTGVLKNYATQNATKLLCNRLLSFSTAISLQVSNMPKNIDKAENIYTVIDIK